ncbi:MAG: serine/threonine protein kinase [Gemmatimonadota bacterium]|nr:serine/threonine protein kinase [Gemmatimonadota bacterium]
MATVYLCDDLKGGGRVAVKVLRPELSSAVVNERFLREIEFASELDHPRIPKVLDSGVLDGLPFYVMTYIEGESLRARLDREKQLPIAEVVRIVKEVVEPTTYAHARGIVHRDIKPENILLAKDGVYVLDFGIARAIVESAGDRITSTGIAVGTPAYMSPEQAMSELNLDARSDVYSLGCVTYEMIAGIPPFVGATAQAVMSRRSVAPAPPLYETRDGVSVPVQQAVAKALSRSPADRWQTAAEFGHALSSPIASESMQHVRQHVDLRRAKYARAIAVTVLLSLVAGGGL